MSEEKVADASRFRLVPPSTDAPTPSRWRMVPPGGGDTAAKEQPKPQEPATTAPGLAASFARGAAPYAAGAAIGGAMGGPPGAVAGMGMVGGAELASLAYNPIARATGLPQMITPQEISDRALDIMGIKRPGSELERGAETLGGMVSLSPTWGSLGDAVATNSAAKAEKFIRDAYNRAIKGRVPKSGQASDLAAQDYQARRAIDIIAANKKNLQFADEIGQVTGGRSPATLREFADAVDQTKAQIFQKYDALQQAAGQAGARVSLEPIAREMDKIAAEGWIKTEAPGVAKYAEESAGLLRTQGTYTPMEAQNAIQHYNRKLDAFYANKQMDQAGVAYVDSLRANMLRGALDHAVETSTGLSDYQEFKNEYKALKTIERDVTNRARVSSRLEKGGGILGRIGDVVAAEEVIRGIVSLDPSAFARGASMKGWTEWMKFLRSPNRAVKKIFETAEGRMQAQEKVREALPFYQERTFPALPPPTVIGQPQPWQRVGEGMMPPESRGFTVEMPRPSGIGPLVEERRLGPLPEEPRKIPQRAKQLPAPEKRLALPKPSVIRGPSRPWQRVDEGMIPPDPGFTMNPP